MNRTSRTGRNRRQSIIQKILGTDTKKVICVLLILFLVFLISFTSFKLYLNYISDKSIEYDIQKTQNYIDSTEQNISNNIDENHTDSDLLEDDQNLYSSDYLSNSRSFTLCAIGDVMCHNTQYWDAYNNSTGEYDFSYVFDDIVKYTMSPDITIGSLETSFAGSEVGYSNYPRFNSPDNLAYSL